MNTEQRAERRRQRQKERYAELRNRRPELYERAAVFASVIRGNHDLTLSAAADIEDALVSMALEAGG